MSDTENWKEKYLSSLGRLEQREKLWEEQERLLRVAISRVTLAGQGVDHALDKILDNLRKATRGSNNFDELQQLVESVSHEVKRLDEARSGKVESGAAPAAGGGLLGRLFGGGKPASTAARPIVALLLDALDEQRSGAEALAGLRQRLDTAGDDAALTAIASDALQLFGQRSPGAATGALNQALLALLDELDFPAELEPRVAALKEQLEQGLVDERGDEAIARTAELISTMRRQMERQNVDLQEFLRQLTERLQDLDQHLEGARTQQQASFASTRIFGDRLEEQVKGIEDSVEVAGDVSGLKNLIQQRLEKIRQHMDAHRREDEERQNSLEQQLAQVTDRLRMVEKEGQDLRDRLLEKHTQAMHDSLTGISNRLAYEERVVSEYNRWRRYQKPLVMLVFDIDNFKKINDTYGHKAGDKALKLIASILHDNLRETDFLARYGGEEFVALMPETDLNSATQVAEKLRLAVEACQFHYQGARVPITISCGIAKFTENDTPETVFRRGDAALYQAKQHGRNQCRTEQR